MSDATFRAVGSAEDLSPGTVNPYYLEDLKRRIAIARVGDALYAFEGPGGQWLLGLRPDAAGVAYECS